MGEQIEQLPELTCDFSRCFPDGTKDESTFDEIETALDMADAECMAGDRWLSAPERIAALGARIVRAERDSPNAALIGLGEAKRLIALLLVNGHHFSKGIRRQAQQFLNPANPEKSGHDHVWKRMGGTNAGCGPGCHCSVPVYSCACGDCDYGMNPEAYFIKSECAKERAPHDPPNTYGA